MAFIGDGHAKPQGSGYRIEKSATACRKGGVDTFFYHKRNMLSDGTVSWQPGERGGVYAILQTEGVGDAPGFMNGGLPTGEGERAKSASSCVFCRFYMGKECFTSPQCAIIPITSSIKGKNQTFCCDAIFTKDSKGVRRMVLQSKGRNTHAFCFGRSIKVRMFVMDDIFGCYHKNTLKMLNDFVMKGGCFKTLHVPHMLADECMAAFIEAESVLEFGTKPHNCRKDFCLRGYPLC